MSAFNRIEKYGVVHGFAFDATAVDRAVEIRSAQ